MDFKNNYWEHFDKASDEKAHDKFLDVLRDIETDTHWEPVEAKNTYFVPLSAVKPEDLAVGSEDAYEDSQHSDLAIAAVLPDGRKYLVRPYLLKNVKEHHGDKAKVLGPMLTKRNFAAFCEHVSLGRPFLKKQILMLVRGQKISGWFSDFNGNWSQLQQVLFFEEKMGDAFPNLEFLSAEVSHYCTCSTYKLDMSLRDSIGLGPGVLDSYVDAWIAAGLPAEALNEAEPIVQFITGESGLTSIEVRVFIRLNDRYKSVIPLGNKLSVNHRGNDEHVWGKFEKFPEQVCSLYQDGLAGLKRMCKQVMLHPYCAMTHALAEFCASAPIDDLKVCAANAEIFWPRDVEECTCYAIDLFNMISETLNAAAVRLTPMRRLRNTETLGRLCHVDWSQFDQKTVSKKFAKSKSESIDEDEYFGI